MARLEVQSVRTGLLLVMCTRSTAVDACDSLLFIRMKQCLRRQRVCPEHLAQIEGDMVVAKMLLRHWTAKAPQGQANDQRKSRDAAREDI
jgi:hypothetical protein